MVGHADSPTRTVYVDVTLTRSKVESQGHGAFELPTIARNCTFLGLSFPPLPRGIQD